MALNLPVTSVKTLIAPVISASDVSAPMPHNVVPRARSASSPMASSAGGICMDLVVQAAPAWMATPCRSIASAWPSPSTCSVLRLR